ncbi:anaerobic ribonucleoside-triphosphate reductase activating protein [Gabonibacter chumensis]|uniref:anaerobic ribonucleoside-triphosphate reductase activating protein n=1 Tax=Gabonibacter chumensis TaxID=2972474 RepID=UPI00257460DE|nr:anaerobic ribonucleoside-triphosphate reductase activating protein [Gabonibacter chumensis]MCR9011368.1 anaerobic ribonucleoside-triphosphate reductase activating protein [Gabonibacter chumensis]
MRIGGLIKQSLIDWEGRVTAVIFTQGCNFRCGYCHNPSLVLPELFTKNQKWTEAELFSFLSKRRQWLDGVVISGGEPTLQPDLILFVQKIKKLGFDIKLDTNGSNPDLLRELIAGKRIDAIAMDVKSALNLTAYRKISPNISSELLDKIKVSIRIIRASGIEYLFRTTVIPGLQTEKELENVKKEFEKDPFLLQEFRNGDILKNYLLQLNS